MQGASATILVSPSSGASYPLRVDHTIVHAPEHYREDASYAWWQGLRNMLLQLSGQDLEDMGQPAQGVACVS